MSRVTLVVDDDPYLGATLTSMLSDQPVEIVAVTNAADAIAQLDQRKFCGLILDLILDGGSGFEVLRHVDTKEIDVPIVVVSSKLPSYVREMLSEKHVKLVFPKPVEPRLLSTIVLGLCGLPLV